MSFRNLGLGVQSCCFVIAGAIAATVGYNALYRGSAVAQIIPDDTLPNNSSIKLEGNAIGISGGSQAGGNLFHSFKEFSIPTGSEAFFNNGADIQNILTRVTGKSISQIDGLIKANGSANLFLINPNGIVFGENARLDIGGSFFGTSAESMKFSDGSEFSAVNPQQSPLLTVNVPLGLQYGANPGSIQVRGNGQGRRDFESPIIDTQDALRVEPDKTLALVGGDIKLEGATLKTAGGRIELGSVTGNDLVFLVPTNKGFILDYSGVENFADIKLSQQATVDASGEGAGDVQVQGESVSLVEKSHIETSTLREKQGGDLIINATDSVEIIGKFSGIYADVYRDATGNSGDLTIKTGRLMLREGGLVSAGTFGPGNSGNFNLTATQSIEAIGRSADRDYGSSLYVQAWRGSTGNAGDFTIETGRLLIEDGAQVTTGTFGSGNSGNMELNAVIVQINGRLNDRFPTGIFANADRGATGNAGNIKVNAREFTVQKEGLVFSGVRTDMESPSNGGDIEIDAQQLLLNDGGQIGAGTRGSGRGGDVIIKTNTFKLIGKSANGQSSSLFSDSSKFSTGNSGDIFLTARELLVRDNARINVASNGFGNSGNLTINAGSINLDNQGLFTANTSSPKINLSKEQATINIDSQDLLLRRGSNITTNATGENVIGGNINIDSGVVTVLENSRISANSNDFRGGRVNINTQGLYGTEAWYPEIFRGYITATGATPELSGEIQVNTQLDPTRALTELPVNLVDASNQISNACNPGNQELNTFVATGRGGLPMNPTEPLQESNTLSDWVRLKPKRENSASRKIKPASTQVVNIPNSNSNSNSNSTNKIKKRNKIIEATGWVVDKDGNIEFVAQANQSNFKSPGRNSDSCSGI